MKKIIAAALIAVMLLVPAVGIHVEPDNPSSVWTSGECGGTMDTFYLTYEDGDKSMMDLYGVRDGGAFNVLRNYPIYIDKEIAIKCRGWTGLHSGVAIDVYGYRINEGSPVFNTEFKYDAEQAVYNAGGDSRYIITIPVAGIKKPALITLVFRDVNGIVHDFAEFPINGGYSCEEIRAAVDTGATEVSARSGDRFEAKIKISGDADLKSLVTRVSWPVELYIVDAVYEQGENGATVSKPADGWESVGCSYDFSWSSANKTLSGDYTFLTLTFEVNGKVSDTTQLAISAEILADRSQTASGKGLAVLESVGTQIKAYAAYSGDVNCDGELNNKDVVTLFKFVNGLDIRMFSVSAADVNDDGQINNKDVVTLFRIATDPPVIPSIPTDNPTVIKIAALQGKFMIYGSTEPNSVIRTVINGKEQKNAANNKYFYVTVEGNVGDTVSVYATAPGKSESGEVRVNIDPVTWTDAVWGGKNSRIFYGPTLGFLTGNQADMSSLANLKSYITNKTIKEIQKVTGKETKIIYAIIPDPATAYYDEQYDYIGAPKTPNTAMQSFVKEIDNCHKDVYALDLLTVLREHKEDRIYFTTDTHYTEFGAYYVYLDIMNRVRQSYPNAKVRTINDGDYKVEYIDVGGGDMCGMIGTSFNEVVPFFVANFEDTGSYYVSKRNDGIKAAGFGPSGWQRTSELENSSNPTAYFLGDSYGCYILPFIGANFSKVWTNEGVLWSYSLDKAILQQNKPDYIILVVCQRNVGPNFMSNLISQFSTSVSGF